MLSITIDEKSISAAAAGQLGLEEISKNLNLPPSSGVTKCAHVGEHGYILSRAFQPGDAVLTISLKPDGPLTGLLPAAREEALGRLLRCTTMLLTKRSRSIPVSWRPFHYRNRLTFQADRLHRSEGGGRTEAGRIVLELVQDTGPRVFAFLLDQEVKHDLSAFQSDSTILRGALGGLGQAIAQREEVTAIPPPDNLGNRVSLDASPPFKASVHVSFDDWYTTLLTADQRRFVDMPMSGSVRLVGPAGTGKTIALVVKCLRELHKSPDQAPKRVLFLTHAFSSANDIEKMVLSMDPEYGIDLLASDRPQLVITTLYSLANSLMRYNLDDLSPVSLDGHEGRVLQAEVLNEVIEKFKRGDWIAFRSACSPPFVTYVESANDSMMRRFFLWELLNEFACVLDAEGIRAGSELRKQYLAEKRKSWMMLLQTREEREVVLRLYDLFGSHLRNEKWIGGDQMIADFMTHLNSFRWEATREQEGFDAIFVDELHLFNRQERMTFRNLLRDSNAPPVVFMAYDAKQSPRDTFMGLPNTDSQQYDLWRDARLGKVEKIELVDVFRYSPQIARALAYIDQSFPGQDLDEEWPAYRGIARTQEGPVPTVSELRTTAVTYAVVFKRARAIQRKLGPERRVAVLCASNDLFRRYLEFSELKDFYHAITSREEASGIPRSAKKFVFSMPEFVAGLQFDTVLLTEVNRGEVPEGPYSAPALRKFVSQVYLGASRAERQLEIYSSSEHGGIHPLISRGVIDGAIRKLDEKEISIE